MVANDRDGRETTPGRGGAVRPAYAALDLGTNNCRLLIARPTARGFRVIDAFSRIVRLGEGLGANGVLTEAAMARTVAALRVCAAKINRRAVARAWCVATDACRRATNGDDFLARVEAETGLSLDVISSREEAQLALAGCLPLVDRNARWALVFDIGGGSTELAWLRCAAPAHEVVAVASLPCGVVSLAEEHGCDRVSRDVYDAMVAQVRDMLTPFESEHAVSRHVADGGVQMLGTSGTVTTLAGVHLGLSRYDRAKVDGLRLSFAEIEAVAAQLLGLDQQARAAIPTIGRDRADLVVAGCAILDAIRQSWPVGSLCVADRGIREGMLMTMIHPCRPSAAGRGSALSGPPPAGHPTP